MQRPLIRQEFTTMSFTVTTAAQSPTQNLGLTSLIDTFLITVPAAAANSIFLGGDQGVTITTGIELLAGTTTQFKIDHDTRQLYELQNLLKKMTECIAGSAQMEWIPFVCWDMSQIYLVAAANTAISLALFKAVYI